MDVLILPSAKATGQYAARLVAAALTDGSLRVLGVATGSSPSPAYAALAQLHLTGWERVRAFALDEYVGLRPDQEQSYHAVVAREVTRPLGLDPARVHVPDGTAPDLQGACRRYEQALADSGGVDLQILGVGRTGHVGFNEPGSDFASRTRVVQLTEQTRRDNSRFFPTLADVPHHSITQGMATIAQARRHILIAHGPAKAPAVRAALEGPVSPDCPASALQDFRDVTVLLDPGAASNLQHLERYQDLRTRPTVGRQ